MKVELSKIQCANLAEFIELNLLDAIRKNSDIATLDYIEEMLDARNKLIKVVAEYEGN